MTLEEFDEIRPFLPAWAKVYVHIDLPPEGTRVVVDTPPPKKDPGTYVNIPKYQVVDC